ncbi:hypothetical protein EJ110_NYTH29338 [Nymphaea thermarum]|nr:hypothetical protein EJ110_NYTH29338 [Nymphaea thermarum]
MKNHDIHRVEDDKHIGKSIRNFSTGHCQFGNINHVLYAPANYEYRYISISTYTFIFSYTPSQLLPSLLARATTTLSLLMVIIGRETLSSADYGGIDKEAEEFITRFNEQL